MSATIAKVCTALWASRSTLQVVDGLCMALAAAALLYGSACMFWVLEPLA